MITILVSSVPIKMQVEMAAYLSLIFMKVAKRIPDLIIKPCRNHIKDYNGYSVQIVGMGTVQIKDEKRWNGKMFVLITKLNKNSAIGLEWLRKIPLDWKGIFCLGQTQFDKIFEGFLRGEKNC